LIRRLWRALQRFWEHDPGLSLILGLLVLMLFVLPSVAARGGERGPLVDLAFSLLLLAGVAGLRVGAVVRGLLLLAALAATVVLWWPAAHEAAQALASLVSLGLMAIVVVAQAFRSGPVNVHRIQGAVAAYLLLGLAWASAYELVAALAPGAFASAQSLGRHSQAWIYYSFVTLTTVGYGDVTPLHPAARSLAVLEALVGQLYPAILLARLVSLQPQRAEGGA
jgi:hypothetical protein